MTGKMNKHQDDNFFEIGNFKHQGDNDSFKNLTCKQEVTKLRLLEGEQTVQKL